MSNALFVAWRPEAPNEGWRPVGRLERDGDTYRFFYTCGATRGQFRPFDQMPKLDQIYTSPVLFPVFANRLLSSSRPEYEEFLEWGEFDDGTHPDPIVILGLSEGRRETDSIEVFPCPRPDSIGRYKAKFFLHGIRWLNDEAISRINRLGTGEELKMMFEVQNQHDINAVAVRTEDRVIVGYFPRYLASDARKLSESCEQRNLIVSVNRVNPDAPFQNRVLCSFEACWPSGFEPCSGEDFEPIPTGVSSKCYS